MSSDYTMFGRVACYRGKCVKSPFLYYRAFRHHGMRQMERQDNRGYGPAFLRVRKGCLRIANGEPVSRR